MSSLKKKLTSMFLFVRDKVNFYRLNAKARKRKKKLSKEIDQRKVAHLKVNIKCNHKWYGTSYGGFYIHPDILNENSIIYSFGIGKDISFDLACIKNHNCEIHAFDPTPKSIDWINRQKLPGKFHFHNYGISNSETGLVDFYLPVNPKGISGSIVAHDAVDKGRTIKVLMKSFDDITNELRHNHIDVLKMDIEGAEYEVLEKIIESPVTIDQLLIEFHDRNFELPVYKSKRIVQQLSKKGYYIFGYSDTYEEISFIHHTKLAETTGTKK